MNGDLAGSVITLVSFLEIFQETWPTTLSDDERISLADTIRDIASQMDEPDDCTILIEKADSFWKEGSTDGIQQSRRSDPGGL